jgi:hypothetical protein
LCFRDSTSCRGRPDTCQAGSADDRAWVVVVVVEGGGEERGGGEGGKRREGGRGVEGESATARGW